MRIRLLIAAPDSETQNLVQSLLDAALVLVPLKVEVNHLQCHEELLPRAQTNQDDLVLLDWTLAGADTPELVRELTRVNPRLRLIVLLPLQLRQYRQSIWEAGVCTSVPKEHLDQEWLASVLCLIDRAMEREAKLQK